MHKSAHHPGRDKDMKKAPLMTAKEKKMAKRAKKHSHDAPPLVTPTPTTH